MSTVDCQASANSQDDEEAGIIDKAERRRMKFPCPPGPTQAAESNESSKLHNNDNCSFQDGGKTTDPRSLLEGKLQVGIQQLALIMVKQITHFVIKGVFLSANPKTDFDPRFAGFRGRKEREIRNWICNLGNAPVTGNPHPGEIWGITGGVSRALLC